MLETAALGGLLLLLGVQLLLADRARLSADARWRPVELRDPVVRPGSALDFSALVPETGGERRMRTGRGHGWPALYAGPGRV